MNANGQLSLPNMPRVSPAEVPAELHALARRLPEALYFGTSTWTFPGWRDLVYQGAQRAQILAHAGLGAYAQHPLLRCVGVDRSHYGPLSAAQWRRMAVQAPAHFRFLAKAHEACTLRIYPPHARYGSRAGLHNPRFLDASYARDHVVQPFVEGLGPQGAVLLFQFAAQDLALLGGPEGFATQLAAFLEGLPRGPLYAVELRNPQLLTRTYGEALNNAAAVHCFNLLPGMPSIRAQAQALVHVRFHTLVLRWMRRAGMTYDEAVARYRPFQYLIDEDEPTRQDIVRLCQKALSRNARSAIVIVNNKAEGCAPRSIARLAAAYVER